MAALPEMLAQTYPAEYSADGLMTRGLIVRHLVLPGRTGMTKRILEKLSEIVPPETPVSLMSQYFPAGRAAEIKGLDRRVSKREYARALDSMLALGFKNGYTQELSSAESSYVPEFDLTGVKE